MDQSLKIVHRKVPRSILRTSDCVEKSERALEPETFQGESRQRKQNQRHGDNSLLLSGEGEKTRAILSIQCLPARFRRDWKRTFGAPHSGQ